MPTHAYIAQRRAAILALIARGKGEPEIRSKLGATPEEVSDALRHARVTWTAIEQARRGARLARLLERGASLPVVAALQGVTHKTAELYVARHYARGRLKRQLRECTMEDKGAEGKTRQREELRDSYLPIGKHHLELSKHFEKDLAFVQMQERGLSGLPAMPPKLVKPSQAMHAVLSVWMPGLSIEEAGSA